MSTPHVTTSITHADPPATPATPAPTALPAALPTLPGLPIPAPPEPAEATSAASPEDTSSLTRPDARRVEASRRLAARLLPPGVSLEQVAVQPGDGLIGAAARAALATVPDAATLLQNGAAARLIAERDNLARLLNQARAGAAATAGDPHEVPTAAQVWAGLLSMDGDSRLQTLTTWGYDSEAARRCRDLQHDPRIADLQRQLRQAQARESELERELDQLHRIGESQTEDQDQDQEQEDAEDDDVEGTPAP